MCNNQMEGYSSASFFSRVKVLENLFEIKSHRKQWLQHNPSKMGKTTPPVLIRAGFSASFLKTEGIISSCVVFLIHKNQNFTSAWNVESSGGRE